MTIVFALPLYSFFLAFSPVTAGGGGGVPGPKGGPGGRRSEAKAVGDELDGSGQGDNERKRRGSDSDEEERRDKRHNSDADVTFKPEDER